MILGTHTMQRKTRLLAPCWHLEAAAAASIACDWLLEGVAAARAANLLLETGFSFANNLINSYLICVHSQSSETVRLWHWSICGIWALWGLSVCLGTRVRACVGNGRETVQRSSSSRIFLSVCFLVWGRNPDILYFTLDSWVLTVQQTWPTLWSKYFHYT